MSPAVPSRVGLYLGAVQLLFALCWTIYVIYLPALAARVGIPPGAVVFILMLDQLVFVASDFAMGVMADRMARTVGRLGGVVLAVTALSCLAFLLLPFAAGTGSPVLFLALTLAWSVTSSALRAPPLTLIGRHAARPARAGLLALFMLGVGVAGALSPYLGMVLRDVDPRLPFLVSSLALALATAGIVAAERSLAAASAGPAAPAARVPDAGRVAAFVLAAVLAALAFQVHVFFNTTPLYRRFAAAEQLPWLIPVFWIGFNLGLWPASLASRRWGAVALMVAAALAAAAATLASGRMSTLAGLVACQAVAGAAWAGVLMGAFGTALSVGHTGLEGRLSGAVSSVLALAALARLATVSGGWHTDEGLRWLLGWLPVAGWLAAAALLAGLALALPRTRAAPA